jgi:hypothetical protein
MVWWMWIVLTVAAMGLLAYILWFAIPIITVWYLRRKAIKYGMDKGNKLWQSVTGDDD